MQDFYELFEYLDQSTSTNEKIEALRLYFESSEIENQIWSALLLMGKIKKAPLTSHKLRQAFMRLSAMPEWLFEESYAHVGDTAETISLLMQNGFLKPESVIGKENDFPSRSLGEWMSYIRELRSLDDVGLEQALIKIWSQVPVSQWFLINKLMTSGFRVGVSEKLVLKALAKAQRKSSLTDMQWHQQLMGKTEDDFRELVLLFRGEVKQTSGLTPVPFCLASSVDSDFFNNHLPSEFAAEWKWDGIRAQLIKSQDQIAIWSRGEELVSEAFPEILDLAKTWKENVILDGELLVMSDNRPQGFQVLQKRLGKKKISKIDRTQRPVTFIAYDIMHSARGNLTHFPYSERRLELERFFGNHQNPSFRISETLTFSSWEDLKQIQSQARQKGAEGLMLKSKNSPYTGGRKRGTWYKFKLDPYTLDAVLIYAQAGSGKRANLFTDYTFALWQEQQLVPFAKAYSGLNNHEIEELDRWIRKNTLEKFGPVRSVKLEQVFEIAFEGLAESTRHKSGIAVRFPRILRWRKDKLPSEANKLEDALKLIGTNVRVSDESKQEPAKS